MLGALHKKTALGGAVFFWRVNRFVVFGFKRATPHGRGIRCDSDGNNFTQKRVFMHSPICGSWRQINMKKYSHSCPNRRQRGPRA